MYIFLTIMDIFSRNFNTLSTLSIHKFQPRAAGIALQS